MNCARNCENLLNFAKVMPKILLVPFFSGYGVQHKTNAGRGLDTDKWFQLKKNSLYRLQRKRAIIDYRITCDLFQYQPQQFELQRMMK